VLWEHKGPAQARFVLHDFDHAFVDALALFGSRAGALDVE